MERERRPLKNLLENFLDSRARARKNEPKLAAF